MAGCSEEFTACVDQWSECTEECPSEEEAEAEFDQCVEDCPPFDPNNPDPALMCFKRCMEAKTACTEACDEIFAECVGVTTPSPLPPPPAPSIRRISANVYEVARPFVLSLVNQPELILRGAPLAPEPVGASGLGFHFFMLDDDSIPRALGAMNGDILWRAEGDPIGPNTAALAVQRLLETGQVHLTIIRNGAPQQFTYRLQ